MQNEEHPAWLDILRRRAELVVRHTPIEAIIPKPPEPHRLLHELQVHQLELEMQNEELRRAQDALDIARARYFDLYDLAPVGYCTLNEQGLIVEANLTASGLLGVARGTLTQQRLSAFILPEDADIYYRHRKQLLNSPEPQSCMVRMRCAQGREFWAVLSSTLVSGGEPPSQRVTISDISELKRAEGSLRQSESRLRDAESLAHAGAITWDFDSDRTTWSDEVYSITGRSLGEPVLRLDECSSLFTPESATRFSEAIRQALTANSTFDLELEVVRPDGVHRQARARGAALRDARGRLVRLACSLQDITEQKQAEAERAALQSQLAQAQKLESIGRLASGVAHDFNNLLAVINGYAGFLSLELPAGDPLKLSAIEICKAGARASNLVAQLLAFSLTQANKSDAVSLNQIVVESVQMLRQVVGSDIEVITRLSQGAGPVLADADQLHQVILNLAVNARDAMPHGGRLEIATREVELDAAATLRHPDAAPGRFVVLTFTDSGTGMTAEVRERIFEPFFTTKEPGRGTGLGLATVYGILRQNGGWIEVETAVGRGSTFRIFLRQPEAAGETVQAEAVIKALAGRGETVLVVDDQQAVRQLARTVLVAAGYQVLEARDGAAALEIAHQHAGRIDVLLTDVVMPGTNGYLLSGKLRQLHAHLRVILTSGYSRDMLAGAESLSGDELFLRKPFGPEELTALVRQALERSGTQGGPASAAGA
ncbi:ATP-binding protein [Paludibaculum fermentans]|uniref:hybrid sensor histidine kinase/response regulator n=1 Tax=Paludibaculum fermentans TaxID=1473598 RepID=UPI003EBA13AA